MKRLFARIRAFFARPPLDIVAVGVLTTLAGRSLLYGMFTFAFAASGLILEAGMLALLIAVDITVHSAVLSALRSLMRFEVVAEIGM